MFFYKKKLDRFCILCAGWTGRKYREISRKLPTIGDEYCVGANENKIFNFPTLSRWPNTTTPTNITTKLKENTRGQWCFRSALHFLPMVLRQGSPVHDHDQRAGKWVFEQRTKWVLRQRRKRAGKWVCTSFQI